MEREGNPMTSNNPEGTKQMTETEHMPTPFQVLDCRELGRQLISISTNKPDEIIARIENKISGRPLDDGDLANAKFIVHACNNHKKVVAVLEAYIKEIEFFYELAKLHGGTVIELGQWMRLTTAKEILAEAKETV